MNQDEHTGTGVHRTGQFLLPLLATMVALSGVAGPLAAQRRDIDQQLRSDRLRLQEIRDQRSNLEAELRQLRAGARNVRTEITNLDQQRTATGRVVNELDRQLSGLTNQLDTIAFELILAEDALEEKRAVLERRMVEIYKRGRLWAFQVLLAAESFGDLLSRYKYLYLVSRQDRAIVTEIALLRDRTDQQRRDMLSVRTQVSTQRRERDRELREYVQLEQERQRTLARLQQNERQAQTEIESLTSDADRLEAQINALLRARAAATRGGIGEPLITDADLRGLEWPVDGEIIYRFGAEDFQDGTRIRQNGIGIRVPVGTPVRAVRDGEVAVVTSLGGYGPQVWIDHGGGFYTVYLYLLEIHVAQDQAVTEGQVLGLSGGESSFAGPHVEFQIRRSPENATNPVALDPLNWLRPRR